MHIETETANPYCTHQHGSRPHLYFSAACGPFRSPWQPPHTALCPCSCSTGPTNTSQSTVTNQPTFCNPSICSWIQDNHIRLSAKRCANGGSDFWLSIKSVSNTLSFCCFVCAFIIGQYHSGNNMSSKSRAAAEILFFESEKRHEIWPLKMDTLTVSAFYAFIHVHDESKHYLSHWFTQKRYRFTQCI